MLRRSLRIIKNHRYLFSSRYGKLHTSVSSVLYSKFDKDLPNPTLPTPMSKVYGPDTDILLGQLKKCHSLDRLLELMNLHLDVMNTKHMVTCLDQIKNYVKENDSKAFKESLMENHIFKLFCTRLMKVIRLFEPQEVITAYKVLCALEIRNNTYVMQCVLKMLGAHLNNMNLGQLTFLNFLLHKQRHNNLVDGLRLAIPLVLQVQIDQQLDSDNLTEVVNCLQLACRSTLKPAVIQKIVYAIIEKASVLSSEDAVTVIFSLLNIDTPIDGYNQLINVAFETVSKNIEDISSRKLCTILRTCRTQRFYNFKFFSTVANLICSQRWSLDLTYEAIKQFHSLDFTSQTLLDYFAEVLCLEYEKHESKQYSLLNCVEYLTATSYQPTKADEAARVLYSDEKNLRNLQKKAPHLYFKFFSCLAMMGHFPPHLLSKLLNEEELYSIWSFGRKLGKAGDFERHLLNLFWGLSLYDETNNFTIPPSILKKAINTIYQRNLNAEYPLTKFIENGLGGSQFLQTGVYTEDGHVIDHVVAMRSGNYPVSLQNLRSKDKKEHSVQHLMFVQDIILPEDAKIIAILLAGEKDYFRDPEILRGWMNLKVRCLAKKNYAVVVVNHAVWKNLPDREKIPYLMREIKQVIPDDIAQKSNYS